jgi:tripartite-type tricarboxylate transporter receptor subunit TctC
VAARGAGAAGRTNQRQKDDFMKHRWLYAFTALLIGAHGSASAQVWPVKPIRVIVPVSAGSTTDIVARLVLDQLSSRLGQPIVVENRPGAGGTTGTAFVAKSDPDGYTILVFSSAHTINPSIHANLSYDAARDFAPVIPLGSSPNVLVISPSRNIKTVHEFVAAAKASPGSFNFASAGGAGTNTHMSAERFRASAGIAAVHIPTKGGPEAMTEVMAGRVDFYFGPVGLVLPLIREGKLLGLAVNSAKRSPALPDLPTTLEAGFADSDYPIWFGMFVPAKTPRDVIDKLHRETSKALQAPKVQERFAALGMELMLMSPAEFDAHVKKEISLNAELVKALGLKPN